jgi:tetratricopeptide (TPR) repeat protein
MLHRRRNHPTANYLAAACFLMMGGLCAATARAQQKVTLSGQVTTDRGGVVGSQVSMQLETANGEVVDQRIAGTDGRYEFPDLENIVYRLRVAAPGFQTEEKEADLTGSRHFIQLNILLVPLAKSKIAAADLPALSDEAAPRKVRKEYEKGRRALRERKLDEAQRHLQKAVQEDPCYARAQTDLALVFVEQKNNSSAEAALRKSIACDADYLEAYARLGILLNGTQRYADGEKILEEGLRRSPNSWDLHFQLAATYSGLGQYDKAKEEYMKVRALNPSPPAELHVRLADLFQRMKDYDKAYAEMQAYLREEPDGRFAGKTRQVMQEMESHGMIHSAQAPHLLKR